MSWTICFGGVCIPVYAVIPLAVIVLNHMWEWFRTNVLGQGFDEKKLYENSRVVHVTSEEQWKELQQKSKETKRTLLVDFSANWCGPCRYIAPIYHELSNKFPCTIFVKVDVDEMRPIGKACGVSSLPTFQFFKNGSKVDEMLGADKSGLEARIKKHNVEVELPEEDQPKPKAVEGEDGLRQRKAAIVKVHSTEEWQQLKRSAQESGKTLVVDFWATWCGPCVKIAPFFEALSAKYPGVVFAKVDVDELEDVSAEENVNAMPTFKVFKQGACVDSLEGAIQSALEAMIARYA